MDMDRPEEEGQQRRETMTPVLLRLFGVDVHRGGGSGEPEESPMDLRKSSSMPDLTINPLLSPEEKEGCKGYASDDAELASGQQKRRRRKAQDRKKGELFFSFWISINRFLYCSALLVINPTMDDGFQRKMLSFLRFRNQPVKHSGIYTTHTHTQKYLRASQRQLSCSPEMLLL
jgi:hypothetical protein